MRAVSGTSCIEWNWARVLFWAYFITYGYFGARTPPWSDITEAPFAAAAQFFIAAFLLAGLGFAAWKWADSFRDSIQLRPLDGVVWLSYFVVLFAGSFERLQFSLFVDELAYAQQALRHALVLGFPAATAIGLDDLPFRYLVQGIAAGILIVLFISWRVIRRCTPVTQIVLVTLALICCRVGISLAGGNRSPHPPLNLIPPLLFGAVLGISDFSLKFSYFVPFTLVVFASYRLALRRASPMVAYLFGLAVGTVPLLWHMSGIVEHSLWAALCFILVFLELLTSDRPNYLRLMSVIALATLMRQPAIIAVAPVLLMFVVDELRSATRLDTLRRASVICLPPVVCTPFLLGSIMYGTPSTPALADATGTGGQVMGALTSGVLAAAVVNSVPLWWLALVPFAFLLPTRRGAVRATALMTALILAVITYYSINPVWFGYAKYQAEYAVPFTVAGAMSGVLWLSARSLGKAVLPALLLITVAANTASFLRMPTGNKPADVLIDTLHTDTKRMNAGYHGLVALPYDFSSAYRAIEQSGLQAATYSMGSTYGVLPEIINNYSARAIVSAADIFEAQSADPRSRYEASPEDRVDAVMRDSRIGAVLLGPTSAKPEVIRVFQERGWRVSSSHRNDRYGSTVVIVERIRTR